MKRIIPIVLGAYLLIAVANKVAEAAGAMTCGCADDCWCKRPGLNVFRWVFPWGHRSAHTAHDKAELDHTESQIMPAGMDPTGHRERPPVVTSPRSSRGCAQGAP